MSRCRRGASDGGVDEAGEERARAITARRRAPGASRRRAPACRSTARGRARPGARASPRRPRPCSPRALAARVSAVSRATTRSSTTACAGSGDRSIAGASACSPRGVASTSTSARARSLASTVVVPRRHRHGHAVDAKVARRARHDRQLALPCTACATARARAAGAEHDDACRRAGRRPRAPSRGSRARRCCSRAHVAALEDERVDGADARRQLVGRAQREHRLFVRDGDVDPAEALAPARARRTAPARRAPPRARRIRRRARAPPARPSASPATSSGRWASR